MFGEACFYLSQRRATFSDGQSVCEEIGGNLVSIHSKKENEFIGGLTDEGLWIGLNDENEEGEFQWTDGSSVKYTSWGPGEPNNKGDEHCTFYRPETQDWNDIDCFTSKLLFVCRRGLEVPLEKGCPRGWTKNKDTGKCYFVSQFAVPFAIARARCQLADARADVVVPRNEKENQFVKELIAGKRSWLGLTDTHSEGNFVDKDGVEADYTAWRTEEPNNLSEEHCVEMYNDGLWNDNKCDEKFHYVCAL